MSRKSLNKLLKLFTLIIGMGVFVQSCFAFVDFDFNANNNKLTLTPGSNSSYVLTLKNPSISKSIDLLLDQADGRYSQSGPILINSENIEKKFLGKWIDISEKKFSLTPGENKQINININIPQNISPGNYIGGISITPIIETVTSEITSSSAKIGIKKYVPIVINIPGEIKPEYNLENLNVNFLEKEKALSIGYAVKNTGNASLIVASTVEIYDGNNNLIEKINSKDQKLGIFKDSTISVYWNKAEYFKTYKVKVVVDINQYDDITDKIVKRLSTKTLESNISTFPLQTISSFSINILYVLIILGVLIAIIIYRNKNLKKNTQEYTVLINDSIEQVANKFNTKWQIIAKLNKLSAPYTLKEGTKILVPINKNQQQTPPLTN